MRRCLVEKMRQVNITRHSKLAWQGQIIRRLRYFLLGNSNGSNIKRTNSAAVICVVGG